jgi:uncharacterized protein
MKLSKYILSTDSLEEASLPGKRIIFSTRTATSILIEEPIYEKLVGGRLREVDPEIIGTLIKKEFLVPDDQDEFDHVMSMNSANKKDSNFLSMTIQPSANCQLGCHYCGQQHTKNYASETVIGKYYERIVTLLDKRKYVGMNITWYGGEPLTGLSAIRSTSRKLIALCDERDMGYMSDMITNGLSLKPEIFEQLVRECKVKRYQITLDGTAESHDQRRIVKNGGATFDIITRNIIDVVNLPLYTEEHCNITIRVNIDRTNWQYVEPLIDFIKDNDLNNKVNIYFAPVVDFGGNDAGKDGLEKNFFAEKEIEWLLRCFENRIKVKVLPERQYTACMVENENSEVLDAFGNIYACWEFPYSIAYSQGDALIGNIFSPEDTYNRHALLRDWTDTVKSGKTWCKTCTHLPVCGGGCPKSWHEGTPACPPFKFNYKDKLLLDYYMRKSYKAAAVQ